MIGESGAGLVEGDGRGPGSGQLSVSLHKSWIDNASRLGSKTGSQMVWKIVRAEMFLSS